MSREVSQSFWDWWEPGAHQDNDPNDPAYKAYVKKATSRGNDYRMLLLALSLDALPLMPFDEGPSHVATAITSVDTLAHRIFRKHRKVQYLLRDLERWGEIEIEQCNGHCRYGGKRGHGGTNHYILLLPEGAEPWKARGWRR